jgi:hypothetical protein
MRGEGIFADQISQMFQVARRRVGIPDESPDISIAHFRRPDERQMALGLG